MKRVEKLGALIWAVGRNFSPNPATRRQGRHALLSKIAILMGLRLYNHGLLWPNDEAATRAWRSFPHNDRRLGERYFNLFYLARAAARVQGNTAECGVWQGAGSHMILSAQSAPEKIHHIFDSFEGLSAPDARDCADVRPAYLWKKHDLRVPEETVRRNLTHFPNIRFHKGWIPSRFEDVVGETFSFVHIDVDLYQPTYDSIAFFYSRMSPGGVIVCDDYGFETCPGAHAAINDFFRDKQESIVHLTTGQGFAIKRCM